MTGCHLLPFRPHPWHLPSQFFLTALQLPHQIWSQEKPFQPPLLRNGESSAQKAPVCLQISFHSKYFTQRATRSTIGVAGFYFGANKVLVVAEYFRDEGTHDFKCLQTEKVWTCLFGIFNRGSDARDISLLLYSPDFCLNRKQIPGSLGLGEIMLCVVFSLFLETYWQLCLVDLVRNYD